MMNTLLPGDIVLVSKLHYGTRFFDEQGGITRPVKLSKIQYDDIMVFNFPEGDTIFSERPDLNYFQHLGRKGRAVALADSTDYGPVTQVELAFRTPYIKRVKGLPGELFYLHNDTIFRDGLKYDERETVIRNPKPKFPKPKQQQNIQPNKARFKNHFPHDFKFKWYGRFFGPVSIPKKGTSVSLSLDSLAIYNRIITAFEGNRLEVRDSIIYINNRPSDKYTFEKDYYLVLGDNRKSSLDSRIWGFVPGDHVIGKAVIILFSYENRDGFSVRWPRVFKPLW